MRMIHTARAYNTYLLHASLRTHDDNECGDGDQATQQARLVLQQYLWDRRDFCWLNCTTVLEDNGELVPMHGVGTPQRAKRNYEWRAKGDQVGRSRNALEPQ